MVDVVQSPQKERESNSNMQWKMTDQGQEGDGKKSREGTTSITITSEIALYTLQGSQASSHKR